MAQSKRRTEVGRKIGLLALSLLVCVLAGEASWRFVVSRRWGPPTVYDQLLGWRYRALTLSSHVSREFDVELRVDRQGRRIGSEGAPGSGLPKVVFVGDSFTFGWGVEWRESFPALLGRELDFEAINLGVSGYGTDQEYLRLVREGLPLGPRAVVLLFCTNDFEEVVADHKYGWTKPRFRFDGADLLLSPAGERSPWLERNSSLYRSLRLVLEFGFQNRLHGDRLEEAKRLVHRLIGSMAQETRRSGARFFVVHSGEHWLARSLDAAGVEQIDIGEALGRAARSDPVTFSGGFHWNARGHRVVADHLREALREMHWADTSAIAAETR